MKRSRGIISPYLVATTQDDAYSNTGLNSMCKRANQRAGITADVTFKDIRALGATDAAKAKVHREEIQRRLMHTSGRTIDIYVKEAVPELSGLAILRHRAAAHDRTKRYR